jgi:tetratricopeptide (TPR) repeat protein
MEETRRYYEVYELKREAARDAENGQYDQSAARWQQVIDREPNVASNQVSLAQSLAKAGRHEAAIEHFVRALGLNAGPQVHRALAEEYAALGRLEDSEKERATFERLQEERLRMLGTVR